MSGEDEIKEEVISELEEMRQRITDLKMLAGERKHAEKCLAEVMALLVSKACAGKDGK